MAELRGTTVAITGGARGIGRATAARLAAAGARVVIGDRDTDLVAEVAAGLGIRGLALDVTSPESWHAFAEAAGAVDVLVNNAGIMPLGPLVDEPDEVTRAILEVNVLGVIHGTKAFAPGMIERGAGQFVNVASAAGRVAIAHGATYSRLEVRRRRASARRCGSSSPRTASTVSVVLPTVVRTELATGVPQARFVTSVEADDVAAVIEARRSATRARSCGCRGGPRACSGRLAAAPAGAGSGWPGLPRRLRAHRGRPRRPRGVRGAGPALRCRRLTPHRWERPTPTPGGRRSSRR